LSPRLVLEIDIRQRLPVVVAYDEARLLFIDRPRRGAVWRHAPPIISSALRISDWGKPMPSTFAVLRFRS